MCFAVSKIPVFLNFFILLAYHLRHDSEDKNMSQPRRKPKKDSLIDFTKKYANNYGACVEFFFDLKWTDGFYCDRCNCTHCYKINERNVFECKNCHKQHSLLAGTIFEQCKLDIYKLILGMFLFFTSNKGVTGVEISSALDINYKSALLLIRKCRVLMAQSVVLQFI